MLNLLCATEGIGWTIALIALLVLMVVYLIYGSISRKKSQDQAMKMINELKKGDKVVTNAGIYGEVVSMRETNMGKVVVIKTGNDDDNKNSSFISVNSSVILGIDKKEDLVLDKDGNVIEPADLKKDVLAEKAEKPAEKADKKADKKEEKKPAEKKAVAKTEKKPAKRQPKAKEERPATTDAK
jgi:preprotein translocase subunit YajC